MVGGTTLLSKSKHGCQCASCKVSSSSEQCTVPQKMEILGPKFHKWADSDFERLLQRTFACLFQ